MKTRKLGNSNLEVSAIGFGCMGLNFGGTTFTKLLNETRHELARQYLAVSRSR
jgi:aryl-alcohol dehydrogenase-like predicted oxidoreductase